MAAQAQSRTWRPGPGTALKALALVAVAGGAWGLRESGAFEAGLAWVEGLGVWAPPAFVALHAVSVVLFVPSVVPTLAAGVLFGLGIGIGLSLAGAGLGALGAFLIGRYLARERIRAFAARDPRFRALDDAVGRSGWRVVALARLTPVFPFSVGNYAFGLSRISARDYLLASVLGTIPSNTVYVYLGTLTGSLAAAGTADRARTPAEWALLALGLVATMVLTLYLRRLARRALAEEVRP